jgi:NADH dehydrogenase
MSPVPIPSAASLVPSTVERPSRILVLGGTGFVGQSVCEALVERAGGGSARIRVPTRRIARARHLQLLPTVETVQADVHDEAALGRLLSGMDAVVNLVAILHGSERAFARTHAELPRTLVRACQAAGVSRIVHVSAIGAAADGESRYQRSKATGEAILRESGLAVTILRPSVIFGARDRFLNLFASLQGIAPFMPLGGARARFQPVWVEDVARAILACLDDPTTIGETIECTGPTVYTLEELVRAAGRWSGRPRPVLALPAPLARLQAAVMEMLPGEPLLSRDNLDSMRRDNVASGTLPGLERLGIGATSLEAVAPSYLGHAGGEARLEAWRAKARRT